MITLAFIYETFTCFFELLISYIFDKVHNEARFAGINNIHLISAIFRTNKTGLYQNLGRCNGEQTVPGLSCTFGKLDITEEKDKELHYCLFKEKTLHGYVGASVRF